MQPEVRVRRVSAAEPMSFSGAKVSERVVAGLRNVIPEVRLVRSGALGKEPNYKPVREIYERDVRPHIHSSDDMQYVGSFLSHFPVSERPVAMISDLRSLLKLRYGIDESVYGEQAIDQFSAIVSGNNQGHSDIQRLRTPIREISDTLRVTFGDEVTRSVLSDALTFRISRGIGTDADREELRATLAQMTGGTGRLDKVLARLKEL